MLQVVRSRAASVCLLQLPKYIVITDSNRNTDDKNQQCSIQNNTALCPVPAQKGLLGARSQGCAGWTTGWRGSRCQQETGTERGLFRGQRGEDETMTLLSLCPFVPGPQYEAAWLALTLCVWYQGPERCPLPVSGPPKDTFQDAHSKTGRMIMSLSSGPSHWPCHRLPHQSCCEEQRARPGGSTHFLVH